MVAVRLAGERGHHLLVELDVDAHRRDGEILVAHAAGHGAQSAEIDDAVVGLAVGEKDDALDVGRGSRILEQSHRRLETARDARVAAEADAPDRGFDGRARGSAHARRRDDGHRIGVERGHGDGVAVAHAFDDPDGGLDRVRDAISLHRARAIDGDGERQRTVLLCRGLRLHVTSGHGGEEERLAFRVLGDRGVPEARIDREGLPGVEVADLRLARGGRLFLCGDVGGRGMPRRNGKGATNRGNHAQNAQKWGRAELHEGSLRAGFIEDLASKANFCRFEELDRR